jgi:hypothetical protein
VFVYFMPLFILFVGALQQSLGLTCVSKFVDNINASQQLPREVPVSSEN